MTYFPAEKIVSNTDKGAAVMYKKITAFLLCAFMLLAFTACRKDNGTDIPADSTQVTKTTLITETAANEATSAATVEQSESESVTIEEKSSAAEESSVAAAQTDELTTEQIIEMYKKAAAKSGSVKSKQQINLTHISINNGQYEGVLDFVTPIMAKLIANNSEDKDGITGGFNDLTADDVRSAKAYKSGDNTVIELVMKEQTSGARENALSGSVGHAITAVGDIGVVVDELTDLGLPMEINDKNTKIYYTDPTVKVTVDNSGKIIEGTWRYTVEIRLDNYKVFGKDVQTTSVIMDNIITVG